MRLNRVIWTILCITILCCLIIYIRKKVREAYLTINASLTREMISDLRGRMHTFQAKCYQDKNKNNKGEYPTFDLLKKMNMLPEALKVVNSNILEANGYYYTLYLPRNVLEQENFYIIYAWPVTYGVTGDFIGHTDPKHKQIKFGLKYSGLEEIPPVDLAYVKRGNIFNFDERVDEGWIGLSR